MPRVFFSRRMCIVCDVTWRLQPPGDVAEFPCQAGTAAAYLLRSPPEELKSEPHTLQARGILLFHDSSTRAHHSALGSTRPTLHRVFLTLRLPELQLIAYPLICCACRPPTCSAEREMHICECKYGVNSMAFFEFAFRLRS